MMRHVSRIWDWLDQRQMDKHVLSLGVFCGTVKLTEWAMVFAAAQHEKPGMEVAAIIAAVTAPYMALQAAAIKYYFESRPAP